MFDVMRPDDSCKEADWSHDLLFQLDWLRFQELVCRLLRRSGGLPEIAWIRPDGSTTLTLIQPARPHQLEAIVQCAPWQQPEISAAMLQNLHQLVVREGAQRGVYMTPGTFSEESQRFARMKPLGLVDGSDLLATFERLPPEERIALLKLTAAGSCRVPSCPSCSGKMEQVAIASAASGHRERDLIYRSRQMEASEVDCHSLTVRKKADVVFMKGVTAGAMTVFGKAAGNIVVNGRLHVGAGGSVSGLVSARAIQLDPGGTMEAEARILNESELAHFGPLPSQQVWRCPAFPKCRATLPVTQEAGRLAPLSK